MHATLIDEIMPRLRTLIFDVDPQVGTAKILIEFGSNKQTIAALSRSEQNHDNWNTFVKQDKSFVPRLVEIRAVGSTKLYGAGFVHVTKVQLSRGVLLDVQDPQ